MEKQRVCPTFHTEGFGSGGYHASVSHPDFTCRMRNSFFVNVFNMMNSYDILVGLRTDSHVM